MGIEQKGKRGGLRIYYSSKHGVILGLALFAKADKEKLSDSDLKEIVEDFFNFDVGENEANED